MKAEINIMLNKKRINVSFDFSRENFCQSLSVREAEDVTQKLLETFLDCSREVFRQWLLQFEVEADEVFIDGKKYRFKKVEEKEF
ncbi:MAG: hypothetical protein LBF88_13415, partial [Planctomycetaceae bacterium]|nr:hypothetical protein [Planctomycetaceae bacterium]